MDVFEHTTKPEKWQ